MKPSVGTEIRNDQLNNAGPLLSTYGTCWGLLLYLITHTRARARWASSGPEISPSYRPLPDNTQSDMHGLGGIRTRNASKRTAADIRLSAATGIGAVALKKTRIRGTHPQIDWWGFMKQPKWPLTFIAENRRRSTSQNAVCNVLKPVFETKVSLWCEKKWGHSVAQLFEALRYKPEGRGFDSRWCQWNFSLT